jgi:hypothetical protein
VNGIPALAQQTRECFEQNGRDVLEDLSVEAVIELVRVAAAEAIEELARLERMIFEPPELATVGVVSKTAGPKAVTSPSA